MWRWTVFTVEYPAVVTPGTHFFFTPSQCHVRQPIFASFCIHIWHLYKMFWKADALPEVCYRSKRPLQIGNYYKNASKLEGNQLRDQVIHMRGCSEALKNIPAAPKPTFMADKWSAAVPLCVFENSVVQRPTVVGRHMSHSCMSQLWPNNVCMRCCSINKQSGSYGYTANAWLSLPTGVNILYIKGLSEEFSYLQDVTKITFSTRVIMRRRRVAVEINETGLPFEKWVL